MLATAAAATSILSLSGSNAFAADGNGVTAGSPGVLSGNSVQAPVGVPVNACGNTADVVGAANPTFGNNCANHEASPKEHASAPARVPSQERTSSTSADRPGHGPQAHAPAPAPAPAPARHTHHSAHPAQHPGTHSVAHGDAVGSPGVGTGNNAKAPADVPVNACGNTADVIGLLNPVMGNGCAEGTSAPAFPEEHEAPPAGPEAPPAEHQTPPRAAAEPPVDRAAPGPKHAADAPRQVVSPASGRAPSADHAAPHGLAQLAATGSDEDLLAAAAASAALLIGGGILYRRGRASSGL
ncbi:chaplin [Streptomyces sp. NPDC059900]|uniref:chaplin n=1 Tax=Streptomyces sp. NPDC059900 TaxID=3155816 RepID=UPI00343BA5FF